MEVFGYSDLRVIPTPAGSLRIEQGHTVPLAEAFTARRRLITVSDLGWREASSRPLWAIQPSHAGVCELLAELASRDPVQTMMLCHQLDSWGGIDRAREKLGLSQTETTIPSGQTEPYLSRWQNIFEIMLAEQPSPLQGLLRLSEVCLREDAERWLVRNAHESVPGRWIPQSKLSPIELFSPDLQQRALVACSPPWQVLWQVDGSCRLERYAERSKMLSDLARLQTDVREPPPAMNDSRLRGHWSGEPLSGHVLHAYEHSSLRLQAASLYQNIEWIIPRDDAAPSRDSPPRGFVGQRRHASQPREVTHQEWQEHCQRTLPSGLMHPGLKRITTRKAPRSGLRLYSPLNSYAASEPGTSYPPH